MKKLLCISVAFVVLSFAACGNGSSGKSMSVADSIRKQDSIEAQIQAEQETLEIQQAEAAAEQAAQEAAKARRGLSAGH